MQHFYRPTPSPSAPHRLQRFSKTLATFEIRSAALCLGLIFALLLLNILTRLANHSLYWIDEAAVSLMVWMALFAASAGIHYQSAIAITLLRDRLSPSFQRVLNLVVDSCLVVFFVVFLYLLHVAFEPVTLLVQYHGNTNAFSAGQLNFIYDEPTMTLGIKKTWVWLILPWFAVCGLLHSCANLISTISQIRLQKEN